MTTRPVVGRTPAGALRFALGLSLLLFAAPAPAQQAYPAPGASYSAAVVSAPGATLAVFGGITGEGADMGAAGAAALSRVAARLDDVGLDRSRILRVRAALAPDADFGAWNTAWTTFFGGVTPPARTTVYSSGLPGDASMVLDVVAMFPVEAPHPVSVDPTRATLNPNLRLAGPASNPTAIVSTRSGLFLSSGALPGRDLDDPTSLESHIRSSMNSLGRVEVTVDTSDAWCEIAVRDTGPGFDADTLNKLFEPFFTTKHRGSGLGLSTAKRVVEMHHGTLTAESGDGGGAVMQIRLPMKRP